MESEAPMKEYFDAESHGDKWHLFCKSCGKGWEINKADQHPGNALHLLNHAREHQEQPQNKKAYIYEFKNEVGDQHYLDRHSRHLCVPCRRELGEHYPYPDWGITRLDETDYCEECGLGEEA